MDNSYDVIEIPLSIETSDMTVPLSMETDETIIPLHAEETQEVVTNDYRVLKNKPTINGTELYDNYNEIDPTVPNWAKDDEPHKMGMEEIYDMWQSIFS